MTSKDRLDISRRACDDTEHFIRRRLLFKCFCQLRVRCFDFRGSLLELLEQADVF